MNLFHQRTADDRASKAAELEQKVALLEVKNFPFYNFWGSVPICNSFPTLQQETELHDIDKVSYNL